MRDPFQPFQPTETNEGGSVHCALGCGERTVAYSLILGVIPGRSALNGRSRPID
jgi:hypothetical protein